MSINALEILSSRIAKGEHFIGRGPLHEFELRLSEEYPEPDANEAWDARFHGTNEYPPYHSREWWDMMRVKREEGVEYPPAVDTDGYEVTPPTGEILAS